MIIGMEESMSALEKTKFRKKFNKIAALNRNETLILNEQIIKFSEIVYLSDEID